MSVSEWFGYFFVYGIIVWVGMLCVFAIYHQIKANRELNHAKWEREEVFAPAKFATDNWCFVEYRGFVLPMRENEKANLWDKMDRAKRNVHLEDLKKALKHGKVQQYWPDAHTCLLVPLSGDLVKIGNDYKAFKEKV